MNDRQQQRLSAIFFSLNHSYPGVLRRVGMSPPTLKQYVSQAVEFLEYVRDIPPRNSRLPCKRIVLLHAELGKVNKDLARLVTADPQG